MADEEGTVETQEDKRKKMEKIKKKEAEKDLKPRLGEIRSLKAKSKSKKELNHQKNTYNKSSEDSF